MQLYASATEPLMGGATLLGSKGEPLDLTQDAIIIGTIRMGYGHYRMARAVATWAARTGKKIYLHDPLATPSPEALILRASERLYSAASRFSAALGGPVESIWGAITLSGGRSSQSSSQMLAQRLKRLMTDLPKDWPVIAAHPWNAHMAVAAGFTHVINLVPDSDPQHFCIVPEALNLAQNEESLRRLLELGVPPERAQIAGHWVPAELCENAVNDSEARLRRAYSRAKPPFRLLFSIGGAGAQCEYLEDLFARLAPLTRENRLRLIINTGDHPSVAKRLEKAILSHGLAMNWIRTAQALTDFIAAHPLEGAEIEAAATMISSPTPLEAVAATDKLIRISDVLVTKPSELAFFPVPKLHIRRVGDHEAASARYSAHLHDGTLERREPGHAVAHVKSWAVYPGELGWLNNAVKTAAQNGAYLGAQKAVELALHRTRSSSAAQ